MSKNPRQYQPATHYYICRHSCGKIVAACVDHGDAHTARFVAEVIRDTGPMVRVTREDYAKDPAWCVCFDKSATDQASFFDGGSDTQKEAAGQERLSL